MRILRAIGAVSTALVVVTSGGLLLLGPAPAQDRDAGQAEVSSVAHNRSPEAITSFSGGAAKAKRARTEYSQSTIAESTAPVILNGATLSYSVPSNSQDLFNVAFSGECVVNGGGAGDYVRITVQMDGINMQPYDGDTVFCSAGAPRALHKGNWVRYANGGAHTLQVLFWVVDAGNNNVVTAQIDDWAFELVVYE